MLLKKLQRSRMWSGHPGNASKLSELIEHTEVRPLFRNILNPCVESETCFRQTFRPNTSILYLLK